MKRAGFYLRVSTDTQTIENQRLVLEDVAQRSGWDVVHVFADEGISGAKGRDKRPGYDALLKAISRREIDIVAAWSVDRLGRSLPDLVSFLSDIQSKGCDLYLHQQAVDTSTPSGRMLFQMLGVFAEFERAIIRSRIVAAHERCRSKGIRIGRPPTPVSRLEKIEKALKRGLSVRKAAAETGVSTATVMRVKQSMTAQTPALIAYPMP
ncbi:MAG: recombinase family protein [Phenylobacterium sp.]|nr:recombinase family protein [Phenylobacterium sp.]